MSYCQQGQKPKVYYTFGNGNQETFESSVSPISVETSSNNLNTYTYYDPNLPGNRTAQGTSYTTEYLSYCQQGQTAIRIFKDDGSLVIFSCYLSGSLSLVPGDGNCVLKINDNSGANIFTVKGQCPVNFTVQCGDCPDGYMKCDCDSYPGYCCIPCSEIKGEIAGLINTVKGINHG